MFADHVAHVHAESYPAEMEDFAANSTELDTYVVKSIFTFVYGRTVGFLIDLMSCSTVLLLIAR